MNKGIARGIRKDNGELIFGELATYNICTINNIPINPNTIERFSGKYYRNGNMMFEGDSVKYNDENFNETYKIKYLDGGFCINNIGLNYLDINKIELIG